MTDWIALEEAKARPGLRLVLARGSYGGYSQAAQALMHVDQVPYAPVPQTPFGENLDLVAWTGVRNNPVAVYDDEPPRNSWLDIINLAERLSPAPRLLPKDSRQRAEVIGLCNELCGENGLVWNRRIETAAKYKPTGLRADIMAREYRVNAGVVSAAEQRMADIIGELARRLQAQKAAGSRYIVGDRLTAIDIYWAVFSTLIGPMPAELCPIAEDLRAKYATVAPAVAAVRDPILFEHRDYIYQTYLPLPVTFD